MTFDSADDDDWSARIAALLLRVGLPLLPHDCDEARDCVLIGNGKRPNFMTTIVFSSQLSALGFQHYRLSASGHQC